MNIARLDPLYQFLIFAAVITVLALNESTSKFALYAVAAVLGLQLLAIYKNQQFSSAIIPPTNRQGVRPPTF